MTHEPDIIREAEAVLKTLKILRKHEEESGNTGLLSFGGMTMSVDVALSSVTPLHGLNNPEPTVRFTYDGTQSDPGDEHKERA